MHHKHILTIVFISLSLNVFAQSDKALGVLAYRKVTKFGGDTARTVNSFCELLFNQNEAIEKPNKLIIEGTNEQKDNSKYLIYKRVSDNTVLAKMPCFIENLWVKDTLLIDWKIGKEKRKIGNFECKNAEADIYGRHYIAWFTEQIPISTGPWKLQGLPGIILEAYDQSKKVQFIFESIEIPTKTDQTVVCPIDEAKQKIYDTQTFAKRLHKNIDTLTKMSKTDPKNLDSDLKISIESIEAFAGNQQ